MKKKEFNKNNTLALKGIAIILMMIHHCVVYKGNYKVSAFPLNDKLVMDIAVMGRICVSIFVFITGYGLLISLKKLNERYQWTKNEIYKWITSRIIKLLSGFWIIAILAFAICQIMNGYTGEIYFKNGIVKGIIQMIKEFLCADISPQFNAHWWYMNIAVLYVISVPIFAKLFKKYQYIPVLLAVIIIPRALRLQVVRASYISFLFPLLLGMIFAEENLLVRIANLKINKNEYVSKILKFIIESFLVGVSFILYKNMQIELYYEINYGIIPVFLICYFYEFFLDLPIVKNILAFLGKHSMNIYLTHFFVRRYCLDWIYSFRNWIIISMVLLIASLLISIVLEALKKCIRYNELIDKFQKIVGKKIDESYRNDEIKLINEKEVIYK